METQNDEETSHAGSAEDNEEFFKFAVYKDEKESH